MTRKHFKTLAENLNFARVTMGSDVEIGGWRQAVTAVADACASHNPRFDRTKFLAAVGYSKRA